MGRPPRASALKLFDHHIHSSRSDGRVSLEDRAKSVAIRPHGVSDHYPWHDLKDHDALRRYMDDAARLARSGGMAGVDTTLYVGAGMQHVFPIWSGAFPEADAAIQPIGQWVMAHTP